MQVLSWGRGRKDTRGKEREKKMTCDTLNSNSGRYEKKTSCSISRKGGGEKKKILEHSEEKQISKGRKFMDWGKKKKRKKERHCEKCGRRPMGVGALKSDVKKAWRWLSRGERGGSTLEEGSDLLRKVRKDEKRRQAQAFLHNKINRIVASGTRGKKEKAGI